MNSKTTRRRFLNSTLGAGSAIAVGSRLPQFLQAAASASENQSGNVLVVIQLSGGNDGLNTVIPVLDEAYYAARPKLAIAKESTLQTGQDGLAFHPSLTGFADLLQDGEACVIQGVGYDHPNRSHFESMDIWHTCQRKGEDRKRGWLGKFLDDNQTKGGDVPAIHFGEKQQPTALIAGKVRVPSVRSIDEFRLKSAQANELTQLINSLSHTANAPTNDLLSFVQSSTSSAIGASQRVSDIRESSTSDAKYPDSQLAQKLSVIAQLINAELATKIFYVELDGFDTHAQQAESHASLLREWSQGLSAFVADLKSQGNLNRVSVLTFSEFGRRVAENASQGTDHGAAAPVYLAGGGIKQRVIGNQPSLTDLEDGDLKYAIDFRSIYATILRDWLKVPDAESIVGTNEFQELYTSKA